MRNVSTALSSPTFVISVPQLVYVPIFRPVEPGVREIVIQRIINEECVIIP